MINAFFISLFSGLSTMIGYIFIFFKIKNKDINKFIVFSLGVSLSIMIGISILELIPSSLNNIIHNYGLINGLSMFLALFILVYGICVIIIKFINNREGESLYKIGVLSTLALLCHNIPEGIITYISSSENLILGIKLGIAITMHNIPEGIMIAVPMYYATKSKVKAFICVFVASLAEPLGALITIVFLEDYITIYILDIILISVGILMITFAINEVYYEALKYNENKSLKNGIYLGILLMIINMLFHI